MAGPTSIGTIGTGREGSVGIIKETTFGCQEPKATTFLEFISESIKNEVEKLESQANIGSRTQKDIYLGVEDINGGFSFEVNPENVGLLVAAAMGKETFLVDTPETGAHLHTFDIAAAKTELPSLQIDVNRGGIKAYRYNGCRVNSMKFSAELHSIMNSEFEIVGRNESADVAQTHTLTTVVGTNLGSKFFYIDAPDPSGGVTEYYVWFDVDAGSTDPAPPSHSGSSTSPTSIEVDILNTDTDAQVATKMEVPIEAIDASLTFTVVPTGNKVKITYLNTGQGFAEDFDTLFTFESSDIIAPTFSATKPFIYTQGTLKIDNVIAAFVREFEYTYNNNLFTDGFTLDGTRFRNSLYEQALEITGSITGEWTTTSSQQRLKYTRNQNVKLELKFLQVDKIGSTNEPFAMTHTFDVNKFMASDSSIGGPDAIDFSLDFKAIKPTPSDNPLQIAIANGVGTAYI